ncbi:2-C-methyl-D-erythritol 4-phosphate cytidylyltransferase [Planctomycetaceae bacterium]|jgi:2-C-methyl-D-erythritol 4-phosphate cytidylyltransferase|nr:2-C-methyl-D-erythritol 4-phosphate cytidylyltransferase [Planctomycetaceae bacterium]MDG2389825.1 2-C-methyl-D-erythritol 4-phosphate cytidylyltransferase [Planctomycetaceae bacterium]
MPKFAVILPAAGKSSRFGNTQEKKVFTNLKDRAVWLRTAEHFVERDDVSQTIIVISPEDEERFKEKFRPNLAFMNIQIVLGGAERADSVSNGLAAVNEDVDFVAVHDAARPLLAKKWIDDVFAKAIETDAAILAHKVASTLKRVNEQQNIEETVSREQLWEAQTPQVFSKSLLEEAFEKREAFVATDEAQLVERLLHPVAIVACPAINLKITTKEDLQMAEHLLAAVPKEKSLGSLHPFADEGPLPL